MSFANRFNKVKAHFAYKAPENTPFASPSELVELNGIDTVYPLRACYINKKGYYGEEAVLITDTHFVNAPKHILEVVKDILNDEQSIQLINDGKVGFKFYQYKNKFGEQIGIEWVDL